MGLAGVSADQQPLTREEWERLLRRLRVRPSKALGQNFLVDPATIDRIIDVAQIEPEDTVLEIGPGLGTLTSRLSEVAARTVAVELDRELALYLRGVYGNDERVAIIERDARWIEPIALGLPAGYKVVANLPYSVATVILRRILECEPTPAMLTVMVQREVAERMTAGPPSMSLLGLAIQLSAVPQIAMHIPPDVFSPRPRVASAVVHLVPHADPLLDSRERDALFRIATIAFQARRKTLTNSLTKGLGIPKADMEQLLERASIDPMRRPQVLSVEEWCRLARGSLGEAGA